MCKTRLLFFLILGLLLTLMNIPSVSAASINPDFRNVAWGMSRDQVKTLETLPLDEERREGLSYYDFKIDNKECALIYLFTNADELKSATYFFLSKHTTLNDYLDDHEDLRKLLIEKYGQPIEDGPHWTNKQYFEEPEQYGLAVSKGHVEFLSVWETDRTTIKLIIDGENYKIRLSIFYLAKQHILIKTGNQKTQDLKNL